MVSGISGLSDMSSAMLQQMQQKRFQKIDKNGDGRLDGDELSAMDEEMTSAGLESFDVDSFIQSADTDGDGLVSESEDASAFAAMMSQAMPPQGPPPGGAKGGGPASFEELDANGDGYLDAEELEALTANGSRSVDEILEEVDTDGDGLVSAEEDAAQRSKMQSGNRGTRSTPLAGLLSEQAYASSGETSSVASTLLELLQSQNGSTGSSSLLSNAVNGGEESGASGDSLCAALNALIAELLAKYETQVAAAGGTTTSGSVSTSA